MTTLQINELPLFLDYFDKIHHRTMRVARCMPPDKLDWTYREGQFTLGDLVRHIATIERYMFAETVSGRPSRYAGCGKELADGYQTILEFAERLHRESMEIFVQLTAEDLNRKCATPEGVPSRPGSGCGRWWNMKFITEARFTFNSACGVPTPPFYGLTSEQVRERSVQG